MKDPYLLGFESTKIRRTCVNPACGKLLSALNKQDVCFCCHDRQMLGRHAAPLPRRTPAGPPPPSATPRFRF